MKFFSLFVTLLCYSASAAPSSSSQPAAGGHDYRLDDMDRYNADRLTEAFYRTATSVVPENIARFQRLMQALEPEAANEGPKNYGLLLMEMIEEDRLEEFQALFPLVSFERSSYDTYLMMHCGGDKALFAEVIYTHSFVADDFYYEVLEELESYCCPDEVIDVIEWLADRDRTIGARKEEFCQDLVYANLENSEIDDELRAEVIMRLVRLGAFVDDYMIQECRRVLPDDEELHQFLTNISIPDIKEPDCD